MSHVANIKITCLYICKLLFIISLYVSFYYFINYFFLSPVKLGDNVIFMNIFTRFYTQSRFSKSRINYLFIDPTQVDKDYFRNIILNNFNAGVNYSILYKVKYNGNYFGMLSTQDGLCLENNKDYNNSIDLLYENFEKRFEEFIYMYSVDYINMIQMFYVIIEDLPRLGVSNINKLGLNKNFLNIGDTRHKFNDKFLPITVNTNYFGKLLLDDSRLTHLNIINKARKLLNYSDLDIHNYDSIYLYRDNYVVFNYIVSENVYGRDVYDAYTGKYIDTFVDTVLDENSFSRRKGKISLKINKEKVVQLYAKKELSIIIYIPKPYTESPNAFIGSIDLETYKDSDGIVKVYALGYIVLNDRPKIFYLDKNDSSDDLVLKCINELLTNKYNGYTFYTHNFGKYDSVFIVAILEKYNTKVGYDYYKLEPLYRDNRMLKLIVKVKKNSSYVKISIIDSFAMFNVDLSRLSESFNLEVTKGHFPHRFVNKDTFYYIGNTPSFYYWDKISKNEYKLLFSEVWDLKEECIKYLIKDLKSLLGVIDVFGKYIFNNYDLQLTDCCTISRLALNIFLKDYLKNSVIPRISSSMYNDIKKSYFGGITEVYKPYGRDLYYYDVNSLYPYSALNSIPGKSCTYVEDFTNNGLNLKDLFGFFYCFIITPNDYLGLLPVRHKTGIYMPNGQWQGWYFSEELKFASENGYKIKVIKGYEFDKSDNVFDSYIKHFYDIKSRHTNHIKTIAKSLLNNLIGRFGLNINKPVTKLVDVEELSKIQSTRMLESLPKIISDNKYMVSYYPEISKEVCDAHNLDFNKIYADSKSSDMERNKMFNDVSISTASAVTSYARIFMSKLKLDLLNKNVNIFYTDTDSIVTDKPLDDVLIGEDIGKFKLEYKLKMAYFISNKTYCLIPYNKKPIIKIKGGINTSFTLSDFVNMYKGIDIEGKKNNTKTFIEDGFVDISIDTLKIKHDSFVKRIKVFENKKWVDTKPCII